MRRLVADAPRDAVRKYIPENELFLADLSRGA